MMRTTVLIWASLMAAATAAVAQTPAAADPVSGAIRQGWQSAAANIRASAEQMPEADYAFKPVDSVRTFGQILSHIAGANYVFCSAVCRWRVTGSTLRGTSDSVGRPACSRVFLM